MTPSNFHDALDITRLQLRDTEMTMKTVQWNDISWLLGTTLG